MLQENDKETKAVKSKKSESAESGIDAG